VRNFFAFFVVFDISTHYLSHMQTITIKDVRAIQLTHFHASYLCKNTGGEWPHFLWRCEIRTMKGAISIEYKMGLGHIFKARNTWDVDKPKSPTLEAVLHSLVLDSEAREMSFNDWCDSFGYDNDSIKALGMYQDCCESAKKLNAVYTREEIKQIKEALQDY
jgi:hypothetical protein